MNNKYLISLSGLLGGYILVKIVKFIDSLGFFSDQGNYAMHGFLGSAFEEMTLISNIFVLGAYIALVIPWLLREQEKDYKPLLVTIMLSFGMLAGVIALRFCEPWKAHSKSFEALFTILAMYGTAFLIGCLACRFQGKKSPSLKRRLIRMNVILLLIALPLFFQIKYNDFPSKKPIATRHAWAVDQFGKFYTESIKFLNENDNLKEQIGEIIELGMTRGPNYGRSGPGEIMGKFTIEAIGSHSKTIVNIDFMKTSSKWIFYGKFKVNDSEFRLNEESYRGG